MEDVLSSGRRLFKQMLECVLARESNVQKFATELQELIDKEGGALYVFNKYVLPSMNKNENEEEEKGDSSIVIKFVEKEKEQK